MTRHASEPWACFERTEALLRLSDLPSPARAQALSKLRMQGVGTQARKARAPKADARPATPSVVQSKLWAELSGLPGAEAEFKDAVPGRRFRLDIAFPEQRLAVEVDGWQYHGKHKADFTRDRTRQNLLVQHGWRVLRFTAGQIHSDVAACATTVRQALGSPAAEPSR